jgi:hypothetical protein
MGIPVCQQCRRRFRPDPRIGRAQKNCKRRRCQRARRRKALRRWRAVNPDCVKSYAQQAPAWAKAYPDYWQHYRRTHPDYYQRDLARRRQSCRAARFSANETSIKTIHRRKLETLKALQTSISSANETSIDRRVEVIVDYLLWKERSANEIAIEARWPGGG